MAAEGGGVDSGMKTVDLSPNERKAEQHEPVLKFDGDAQKESSSSITGSIEGTEVQSMQQRRSRTASFREWTSHQVKITKQIMSEKFGRGTRTVDSTLDDRIESLRDTQRKYSQLLILTNHFQSAFSQVLETQKSLAEQFAFLSVRSPDLHTEFSFNSEAQKRTAQNGETLLEALKLFFSNVQTICSKTIEDTLQTVKVYESTRLNYDAYRNDLEALQKQANASQSQQALARLASTSEEFEKHKNTFEKLRNDVDIKLKLLDENKVSNRIYQHTSANIKLNSLAVEGDAQTTGAHARSVCRLLLWQQLCHGSLCQGTEGEATIYNTFQRITSLAGWHGRIL